MTFLAGIFLAKTKTELGGVAQKIHVIIIGQRTEIKIVGQQ